MIKTFIITFVIIIGGFLAWAFLWPKFPKKLALQVFSNPQAQVFLNDKEVGKTPYQNENVGQSAVTLRLVASSAAWVGGVKLFPGTISVVNRDLNENPLLGAGEILTLEPGRGLFVISIPDEAEVEVDGKKIGRSPVSIEDLPPGDHRVVVSKTDHTSRAIQVKTHPAFKLVLSIQLGLSQEKFAQLAGSTASAQLKTKQVRILDAPTGFLRVRDKPSLAGAEVGRVSAGETFAFLEEQPGWVKIRVPNPPLDGWVSLEFVRVE